jgi:4-alpha-glucanotransferase
MDRRRSGILLHITSLPSPFGIGDLGPEAYAFIDFLNRTGQSYWQLLPLTPTDPGSGNSPYSSISSFAGNTLMISPQLLVEAGYLTREEIFEPPFFPLDRCDFPSVSPYKSGLLCRAYDRFKANRRGRQAFEEFCHGHRYWLDDYALFVCLKNHYQGKAWGEWDPGHRDREPSMIAAVGNSFPEALEREKFFQYLFFSQWSALKTYAQEKNLRFIGDLPIYVNYDSADVWTHPDLFRIGQDKRPLSLAGVPPDYFSQTGQLWGNPTYCWERLQETGFQWWLTRVAHHLELQDILRIDHFRGLVAFWEVPSTETTAMHGEWREVPTIPFFTALLDKFPASSIIAEDLGYITPDVKEVMNRFGFPGMRILLFAFGEDNPDHLYLPHNYIPHCVAYTGTHDNNTVRGWFENETGPQERQRLFRYLGREVSSQELPRELIRLVMLSPANTIVVPLQDLLGLGREARMNIPSTARGNWEWRFLPNQLTPYHGDWLGELTATYGRAR